MAVVVQRWLWGERAFRKSMTEKMFGSGNFVLRECKDVPFCNNGYG